MRRASIVADTLDDLFAARARGNVANQDSPREGVLSLWEDLEGLGFTSMALPDSSGATGATLTDAVDLLRVGGRHAVDLPLAETAFLARWALTEAGLGIPPGICTVAPAHPADTIELQLNAEGGTLLGRALLVPWAAVAAQVVVLAKGQKDDLYVCVVHVPANRIVPGTNIAGEPRDAVDLTGLAIDEASFAPAAFSLETYFLRGALARSAQLLGALEAVRDLTISYAQSRHQFGRRLAEFQAVQQMLAQVARDVALTEAAIELTTSTTSHGDPLPWLPIASAKTVAGQSAGRVAAFAHQIHGAIGVTNEYPLSRLTQRLWAWRGEYGSEEDWSAAIGERAARHSEGVWGFMTESVVVE